MTIILVVLLVLAKTYVSYDIKQFKLINLILTSSEWTYWSILSSLTFYEQNIYQDARNRLTE